MWAGLASLVLGLVVLFLLAMPEDSALRAKASSLRKPRH